MPPAQPSRPSTEDLLAQICTQDLQFTQADLWDKLEKTDVLEDQDQDFDDDITDNDLEGAVLEAEKSSTSQPTESKQTDSFCNEEFDFSTQELRELVY